MKKKQNTLNISAWRGNTLPASFHEALMCFWRHCWIWTHKNMSRPRGDLPAGSRREVYNLVPFICSERREKGLVITSSNRKPWGHRGWCLGWGCAECLPGSPNQWSSHVLDRGVFANRAEDHSAQMGRVGWAGGRPDISGSRMYSHQVTNLINFLIIVGSNDLWGHNPLLWCWPSN